MHAKLRRQKCWSRPVSSSTVEPDGRTSAPVNWFSELAIRGWIVTPVILMQLQLTTRLPLLSTYIGARSFWVIFIFFFPPQSGACYFALSLYLIVSFISSFRAVSGKVGGSLLFFFFLSYLGQLCRKVCIVLSVKKHALMHESMWFGVICV